MLSQKKMYLETGMIYLSQCTASMNWAVNIPKAHPNLHKDEIISFL